MQFNPKKCHHCEEEFKPLSSKDHYCSRRHYLDSYIDKESSPHLWNGTRCWEWTGSTDAKGYGQTVYHGVKGRAHCVSFHEAGGKTTEAKPWVLHCCNNPRCCRPDHLYAGNHKDNMVYMALSGRAMRAFGSKNGQSRLSEAQVLEIYHSPLPDRVLAAMYGVSWQTIRRIKNGERGSHVTGHVNNSARDPGGRLSRVKADKLARQNARLCSEVTTAPDDFCYAVVGENGAVMYGESSI